MKNLKILKAIQNQKPFIVWADETPYNKHEIMENFINEFNELEEKLKDLDFKYSRLYKFHNHNCVRKDFIEENLKKAINNEIDLSNAMFVGDYTNGYIQALKDLLV